MFLNRVQELQWLTQRYQSDRAEFIIMTGRRRVGKTALPRAFAGDKEDIYFRPICIRLPTNTVSNLRQRLSQIVN